jgi:hypothetical protein
LVRYLAGPSGMSWDFCKLFSLANSGQIVNFNSTKTSTLIHCIYTTGTHVQIFLGKNYLEPAVTHYRYVRLFSQMLYYRIFNYSHHALSVTKAIIDTTLYRIETNLRGEHSNGKTKIELRLNTTIIINDQKSWRLFHGILHTDEAKCQWQ